MMRLRWERQARMALGRVEQRLMISISAYQSHEPVRQSCAKHHLQGVWGAARPPSGEREGRSPLAFAKQCSTTARSDKHHLQGSGGQLAPGTLWVLSHLASLVSTHRHSAGGLRQMKK